VKNLCQPSPVGFDRYNHLPCEYKLDVTTFTSKYITVYQVYHTQNTLRAKSEMQLEKSWAAKYVTFSCHSILVIFFQCHHSPANPWI
jgi:hypothetical protein